LVYVLLQDRKDDIHLGDTSFIGQHNDGQGIPKALEVFKAIVPEVDQFIFKLGNILGKNIPKLGFVYKVGRRGPRGVAIVENEGQYRGITEVFGIDNAGMIFFGVLFVVVQDQADILEHLEIGTEINLGFVFQDRDNKKGRFTLEVNTFDRIRVPVLLEEWQKTLAQVLNVLGLDILEEFNGNIIPQEFDKELWIAKNDFKAIILDFMDRHRWISSYTIYAPKWEDRFNSGEKNIQKIRNTRPQVQQLWPKKQSR
jgi:hypothetical protein